MQNTQTMTKAKANETDSRTLFVYRLLKKTIVKLLCRLKHFSSEEYTPDCGPYIVMANHNTDLDPVFVARAFSDHMYFVASEHLLRKVTGGKLLVKLVKPILRDKSKTEAAASMAIIRRLKKGDNICMFPEGNRSYNGVTGPVYPATGKLVKASGASLVTYRMEGGYLSSPRWSKRFRKGRITGEIAGIYKAEELKKMSVEEINELIAKDIYVDAFESQERELIAYKGIELAENLEYALYCCPACGQIGKLRSKGDLFGCDCGFKVRYSEYGVFEIANTGGADASCAGNCSSCGGCGGDKDADAAGGGSDDGKSSVRMLEHTANMELFGQIGINCIQNGVATSYVTYMRDWDRWQTTVFSRMVTEAGGRLIVSDENATLCETTDHETIKICPNAPISIDGTSLRIGEYEFMLEDISNVSMIGANEMIFSAGGCSYELQPSGFSGKKYADYISVMRGAQNGL